MQRGTERRDQGRRGNGGYGDGQMGDMARSMAVMQEVLKKFVPEAVFCNDGRLSTPRIAENNDLNVFNNRLINISVNPNVHE